MKLPRYKVNVSPLEASEWDRDTHHVFDLREGDLQGHIEGLVRVLHGPQSVGVVLYQVSQKLLGVASLGRIGHWRIQSW